MQAHSSNKFSSLDSNVNCLSSSKTQLHLFHTALLQKRTNPNFSADDQDKLDHLLWELLLTMQNTPFYTARQLEFSYYIRGNEMFVNRKNKSITRSSVCLAFHTALEMQENGDIITGPKKLKTFGASYLYPIFLAIGVKYL